MESITQNVRMWIGFRWLCVGHGNGSSHYEPFGSLIRVEGEVLDSWATVIFSECVFYRFKHLAYLDSGTESLFIDSVFKNEGRSSTCILRYFICIITLVLRTLCHLKLWISLQLYSHSLMKYSVPGRYFAENVLTATPSNDPFLYSSCYCVLFLTLLSFRDNVAISVASRNPLSVLCSHCVDYTIWVLGDIQKVLDIRLNCWRYYIVRKSEWSSAS
jgi:hypothetical protein